jgi:hypothetical protein
MRAIVILAVLSLLVLAACGGPKLLNPPNQTEQPVAAANNTVTENTIEQGTVTPTETAPEAPVVTPPAGNETAPIVPVTPPATVSGCPLISPEDVAGGCNKSDIPNVTIDGLTCRFAFGPYEVNVTSQSASLGDYNAWVNTIPTSQDGKFKPVSMIAEYNRMKYYGWYTGKRLIIVTSNNVLACALSKLDGIIERVNPTAAIAGEVSTADKLSTAVADAGRKTLTNVDLATLLTMPYDTSVTYEGNYSGNIRMTMKNGYNLLATLKDVPDATYNGYLVRKTNWHAIKLGPFEHDSDAYRLIYASTTDLRDHNWFVLTTMKDGKETVMSETSLS